MQEDRALLATQDAETEGQARWRPVLVVFAVLTFLVALLVALALTYGWDALTGISQSAPNISFVVRAAFSAVLIFLGVFALTGLWLPAREPAMSTTAPQVTVVSPVAKTDDAEMSGEKTPDTEMSDAEHAPVHRPVRATDLPRILFDTNELPAVTARQKMPTSPPGRHIFPPVAEPRQSDAQD